MKLKNKVAIYASIGILPIIGVATAYAVTNSQKTEKITKIKYSLDQNLPNIIFVYSDGFDRQYIDETFKKFPDLKTQFDDFYDFKNLMGAGNTSHYNLPLLSGKFKRDNHARLLLKVEQGVLKNTYVGASWGVADFVEEVSRLYKDQEVNKITVNYVEDAFDKKNEYASALGVEEVNFQSIRDYYANKGWGTTNYSPNSLAYKWLQEGEISDKNKPAIIFTGDLITHVNYSDKYGDYRVHVNPSLQQANDSLVRYLDDTFTSLKNIKNKVTNAYDNSMIILWGDHTNHIHSRDAKDVEDSFRKKTNPQMYIKYPNQRKANKGNVSFDDYTIYQTQIIRILSDFIAHKKDYFNNQQKIIDDFWVPNKNTNFKFDRYLPLFSGEDVYLGHYYIDSDGKRKFELKDSNKRNYNKLTYTEQENIDNLGEWHNV